VPIFAVGALAVVTFVGMYNTMQSYRNSQTIGEFFMNEGTIERYFYAGSENYETNYIGRFDSAKFAVERLSRNPLEFAFGLGAGNVSTSVIADFNGEYADYFDRYGVGMTQVSNFLWEIGLVGLGAYLFLYWFVFTDARALGRADGPFAALGHAWTIVMLIMAFALIYKSIFSMNEIGYLFWYFSGVVASQAILERERLRARGQRPAPAAWRTAAGELPMEGRDLGLRGG
jgi:hypothetical protein